MKWKIVGGEHNRDGYWIAEEGSKLQPFILKFVHPANHDIELGRYINLTAAKEAAETHAGVTA